MASAVFILRKPHTHTRLIYLTDPVILRMSQEVGIFWFLGTSFALERLCCVMIVGSCWR